MPWHTNSSKKHVWYNRNCGTMNEHFPSFYWDFILITVMGNTGKPHTKLSPTLISIVVYMSRLAHFTVVLLQRGFWCTFVVLFHYWSYIAVFLWCYYPDAEIPADIIEVLSKIKLTESSCWKLTFYQRSLNAEHTLNYIVKVANAFSNHLPLWCLTVCFEQ